MNLTDYVQIIRRRGWIVLLAVLLTTGSALVLSKAQTPLYRSTQRILIAPARNDFGLTQTMVDLLNSYVTWMSTLTRAQTVIDTLKLDNTPDQLLAAVQVTADRNNDLLNIDVTLPDGEQANRIARAYGDVFYQWRVDQNQPLQLQDRINAELLDMPRYAQIRPTTTTNVAAGALLGLLIGGAVVFVIETLSASIIQRTADIERVLQVPLLGAIPDTAEKEG